MKYASMAFAALTLAGCASAPTAQSSRESIAALEECQAADYLKTMDRFCNNTLAIYQSSMVEQLAKQHWDSVVATLDPNMRLMASVMRDDLAGAVKALDDGANANHVFRSTDLSGPGKAGADSRDTPLMVAASKFSLEMIELLLKNGADPHWKQDENHFDVVVNYLNRSAGYDKSKPSGLDIGRLAVRYGYKPDAKALLAIEDMITSAMPGSYGHVDAKPFLNELLSSATPDTLTQMHKLRAERKGHEIADKAKKLADEKSRQKILETHHQRVRNEKAEDLFKMRSIGARICQDRLTQNGYVTIIGFVENLAPLKAQVRISDVFYRDAPALKPGGFSSSIIWDDLRTWRSCEQ